VDAGATLDFNNFVGFIKNLQGAGIVTAGTAPLTIFSGNFSGVIAGSAGLTKANFGTAVLSDVGFRASYQWQAGTVQVEPFLKATWQHEFKYSALPITASFANIPGPSATYLGPSEGHDSAVVDAGLSVSWTPCISTYVSYNGLLGRDRYDSNGVSGGVRIRF
jgi:outer membrane autotransporter protein